MKDSGRSRKQKPPVVKVKTVKTIVKNLRRELTDTKCRRPESKEILEHYLKILVQVQTTVKILRRRRRELADIKRENSFLQSELDRLQQLSIAKGGEIEKVRTFIQLQQLSISKQREIERLQTAIEAQLRKDNNAEESDKVVV